MDAEHPLLRRGRPMGQVLLDRLDDPGRSAYGALTVQEVEARSALSDFQGAGFEAWSLNPYAGCQHQCSYCYVPDTIHAQRERWGRYVLVKKNLPTVLMRELRRRPRRTVYVSTATDPYQPVEAEHRVTQRCLRLLSKADWPVDVLTRSPLVCRDLDLLADMRVRVGLSVPTLDDRLRQAIEPHAPPIEARLDALRALGDAGIATYANLAPAYPFTDTAPRDIVAAFQEAGVGWVNTSPWRRRRTILPVVAARLRGTPHEHLLPSIRDDQRQRRIHQTLQVAFRRAGVPLNKGFFSPPFGT